MERNSPALYAARRVGLAVDRESFVVAHVGASEENRKRCSEGDTDRALYGDVALSLREKHQ